MSDDKRLHCRPCNAPRAGASCHKCGGPLTETHPEWEFPAIPDIDRIRELAKEVGYAVGVHGSLERDLDLIAAPWSESAVSAEQLCKHIADGMGGIIAGLPEQKPLGRYAVNIQVPGWFKLIDLSVAPMSDMHRLMLNPDPCFRDIVIENNQLKDQIERLKRDMAAVKANSKEAAA